MYPIVTKMNELNAHVEIEKNIRNEAGVGPKSLPENRHLMARILY